jgi:hypothetical protein
MHMLINSESDDDDDDDYTFESYDYEMVDEKKNDEDDVQQQYQPKKRQEEVKVNNVVIVETVQDDDDDDAFTYEEEEILEVVMENDEEDVDSTAAPPPLPLYRATESSPVNKIPPYSPMQSRRNNDVVNSKDATVLLTPSKQRAKAANSTGLSELSKQLRIHQAKNESQSQDINRLERQLRILADLQGISVSDLRKALEDACASEAFGELQNRVSKLKFELEAATLAKRAELRKDAAAPFIANLELRVGELEEVEEASRKKVEDLYTELRHERAKTTRIESENQQLKHALQNMITRLKNETARAAHLEKQFQNQMQQLKQDQSKRMHEKAERSSRSDKLNSVGNDSSSSSSSARMGNRSSIISPEMAAEYEQMVQLLKDKDEQLRGARAKLHADEIRRAEKLKEAGERARKVQMDMKVEMDKLALTVKELEDVDGQSGLRLAQYKARFAVQDERIVDMGQQLDSLYTAFTLLKEEFDSENDRHTTMLENLNDADAEIARQTNKMEKEKSNGRQQQQHNHGFPPTLGEGSTNNATNVAAFGSNSSVQSVPRFINTSFGMVDNSTLNTVMMAPVSPSTPNTANRGYVNNSNDLINNTNDNSYGYETPTTYASARAFHSSPERTPATERTPSTWQLLFPPDQYQDQSSSTRSMQSGIGEPQQQQQQQQQQLQLISGPLIVESNSMLRKWKTKPSKIYLRGEGYQWEIGDKKSFPIRFGISTVAFHPNYPLSFVVHLDPTSSTAPVIRAAAANEHDYHRWMAALYKATSGVDYEGGSGKNTPEMVSPPAHHTPSLRSQLISSSTSSNSRRVSSSRFSNGMSNSSDSARSIQSAPSMEEQEGAELERILEISKRET